MNTHGHKSAGKTWLDKFHFCDLRYLPLIGLVAARRCGGGTCRASADITKLHLALTSVLFS
jgi:hypothetical protein